MGSREGGEDLPFVMAAMGYNIEGGFPRVLEVLGTFPSSGDSWDAPPPLKEWGSLASQANYRAGAGVRATFVGFNAQAKRLHAHIAVSRLLG